MPLKKQPQTKPYLEEQGKKNKRKKQQQLFKTADTDIQKTRNLPGNTESKH